MSSPSELVSLASVVERSRGERERSRFASAFASAWRLWYSFLNQATQSHSTFKPSHNSRLLTFCSLNLSLCSFSACFFFIVAFRFWTPKALRLVASLASVHCRTLRSLVFRSFSTSFSVFSWEFSSRSFALRSARLLAKIS